MKKIRIFIGSSIDDLAYERRDLVSFIAELNNKYIDKDIYIEPYICEEKSNEMRPDGSQKVHDDYIKNDADATIFMFYQKAGQYTLRELDIARKELKNSDKKMHVLIFFKTINNDIVETEEIKMAVDKIAGEYAHYYKKFTHTDTIKLEILQYLATVLGEGTSLSVIDGKVHIGDIIPEDISLENVYAYQNNEFLLSLKKEIDSIEKQIQECVASNDWKRIESLSQERKNKTLEYEKIQIDILKILKQLYNDIHSETADPMRLKALMLMEEGKHREAQEFLPIELIESKSKKIVEQKKCFDSIVRAEAIENIKNAYARIHILSFNDVDEQESIEKTYESIFEIAPLANNFSILIEYIDFLIDIGKKEKALLYAQRVAKILENPESGDLYSRFDIYNIMSELSESALDKERFEAMAKDSLITYIERLDPYGWRLYAETCIRIAEYVDWLIDCETVKRYLIKAISVMKELDGDGACTQWINKCDSILKNL